MVYTFLHFHCHSLIQAFLSRNTPIASNQSPSSTLFHLQSLLLPVFWENKSYPFMPFPTIPILLTISQSLPIALKKKTSSLKGPDQPGTCHRSPALPCIALLIDPCVLATPPPFISSNSLSLQYKTYYMFSLLYRTFSHPPSTT